ncbi:MAG: MFS transporter [Patescibacteria group bacterium]
MLKRYLEKQQLNQGAIDLFIHHIIRMVGTGLLGIFGPIYVYQVSGSVSILLLYNALVFLVVAVFDPLMMRVVNKIGFKSSMVTSLFFISGMFGALYMAGVTEFAVEWLIVAALLQSINIMLYWVPYHVDFTELTNRKTRGENLALLTATITIIAIILPVTSSSIIERYGFGLLFILSVAFVLFSSLYVRKIPVIKEKYSYGYLQTYRELFSKKHRRLFIGFFADGVQGMVGAIIWPVFIFLLLEGDFYSVGIITAVILLATVIIRFVVGDLADHMSKSKLVKYSTVFHALGWVFKSIVATPFQIFLAGTYHDMTGSATRVSFDSLMYEQADKSLHYIDEYSVLREISLCMARVVVMVLAVVMIQFAGIESLFWVAAVASLFMGFL